jgi:hypothetical protein
LAFPRKGQKRVTVRKTESRIPANFQATDLGEAVVAADGRCTLVSFITSPLTVNRENIYVIFVTDAELATSAQSCEWIFTENGVPITATTEHGEKSYSPQSTGELNITIRILDKGRSEQAKLVLTQNVVQTNPILEDIISHANNQPGPGIGNPDVTREVVNSYSSYYQDVKLQTPEQGEGFLSFVFSMVLDGAMQHTPEQRKRHADQLAQSLNNGLGEFTTLVAQGVGVCGIRLALLAMSLQPFSGVPALLDWTELPEVASKRDFADQQLREKLTALGEDKRIDLFNLARFPKSNITLCAKILEALRDRYFGGTKFDDVLTGMSGARAQRIVQHYQKGPLLRS